MKLGHSLALWNTPLPHRIRILSRPTTTSCVALSTESPTDRVRLAESLQFETLKILEWPSVCTQLSAFASTSMGLVAAQSARIPLGRSPVESSRLLAQTSAAVAISRPLDFSGIEDVSWIIDASVAGEMLSIGELCAVRRTLRSARSLIEQLEEISSHCDLYERCSPLLEILRNCDFLMELEQKIEFCIDCNFSVILDRASEELEIIRSERKRNMENLEAMLKQISTRIFQAGGIDRPLVTKRRSRMCVAIRTTHRSLLPNGVVLDSSGSGATYFMEPREAVDLNNMEVGLSNSEKIEEQAILSFLSAETAKSSRQIKYLLDRVLEVDLAFARAAHARWINGVCPTFSSESCEDSDHGTLSVDVNGMQHPLLLESSLGKPSRSSHSLDQETGMIKSDTESDAFSFPVPVDIKIGYGVKVVVISGPNTGGKTASMKTLGLASVMLKAGMYLPAQNHPRLPWFDLVLADIGDHQNSYLCKISRVQLKSLEQSLSTFSGHISRICKILKVASERSLVLLDEIGSGTDPSEGVALSSSILQYLKDRVNLAVVTTHYADLTRLKEKDKRFENAAMEFSLESLQPTYRILWGSIGDSNALSIAKTIGFDGKLIEQAQTWVKKLTPEKMQKFNSLLYQSLSEERNKLEAQAKKAASLHSDILKLYSEIHDEADDLDVREAALKAKERQQIQEELKVVKTEIDTIVQEFEKQLKNAGPNDYNMLLKKAESIIATIVQAHQPPDVPVDSTTSSSYIPQIGEKVLIKGLGNKLATVVEAPSDDNTALVQYGKIRVRLNLNSINALADGNGAVASAPRSRKKGQRVKRLKNLSSLSETIKDEAVSYGAAVQTSKNTVDLRGMQVEEATLHVNMAINSRGSNSVLFIIHGMGTGVLKEHVLQILRNHPRIAKFEQESAMNYGCTVAYINFKMLAVFEKSISKPPKELSLPIVGGNFSNSSTREIAEIFRSWRSDSTFFNLSNEGNFLALSHEDENPVHPRSIVVIDDIFCIFSGALYNTCDLRKYYGMSRQATEAMIIVEAYKVLRDRALLPIKLSKNSKENLLSFCLIPRLQHFSLPGWDRDGCVQLHWGTAADGSLVCADDPNVISAACGKCYTPFPPGCIFISRIGLISFDHPLNKVRGIPREDDEGNISAVIFQVDLFTRLQSIPRTGSAANWASAALVEGE
ncbi:hypothetical protein BUALT_Bualt03G0058100 [Buddleja alternifolia]|uniref:Smr domain-containing protein n=1 Tax=Buddleja alternifolia TaxID=168488 RepID=A0AAV6XZR2_9LAMI|nr:hypothetical protein BUALT_Bualt03G0058100 [Buddleja alternifolia]